MSASLKGKTIAFSGPFAEHGAKRDAIAKALKAGATVSPTVSKNVDIVFKGDAKIAKPSMGEVVANYHGTKVLSANSFMNYVRSGGADRMKKVAALMKASSATPRRAAAPVAVAAPIRKVTAASTTGRVRAVAPPPRKKITAATTNANNKALSAEVPLATIYADKTPEEIEKMEQEAAKFGPMPWLKNSTFSQKQQKMEQQRKARSLKAKQAAAEKEKAAAAKAAKKVATKETAEPAVVAEAPAAPVAAAIEDIPTASTAASDSATITADGETNTIIFTPSKGLSVKFSGDFEEFCRVAAQLSDPVAAAASAAAAEQQDAVAGVVIPQAEQIAEVKPETKAAVEATPVPEAKQEATAPAKKATTTRRTQKKRKTISAASAAANLRKKALPLAIKKAAGRARRVVTTKELAAIRGLTVDENKKVNLQKKVVSFTGTFFQLKRMGLQALATKAGAFVSTGVAKDIDYLVVGADAAHKKKLAKSLGVPTITEKAFIGSCKK